MSSVDTTCRSFNPSIVNSGIGVRGHSRACPLEAAAIRRIASTNGVRNASATVASQDGVPGSEKSFLSPIDSLTTCPKTSNAAAAAASMR
jgi:hypothetical protein